jgi:hypothetical protein
MWFLYKAILTLTFYVKTFKELAGLLSSLEMIAQVK